MVKDNVSIREVYQLIDSKISQVNSTVLRVETKLDNLESGRISLLESKIANIDGRLMFIPLAVTIAINAFIIIIEFILKLK